MSIVLEMRDELTEPTLDTISGSSSGLLASGPASTGDPPVPVVPPSKGGAPPVPARPPAPPVPEVVALVVPPVPTSPALPPVVVSTEPPAPLVVAPLAPVVAAVDAVPPEPAVVAAGDPPFESDPQPKRSAPKAIGAHRARRAITRDLRCSDESRRFNFLTPSKRRGASCHRFPRAAPGFAPHEPAPSRRTADCLVESGKSQSRDRCARDSQIVVGICPGRDYARLDGAA
jgi:hypothetical protein